MNTRRSAEGYLWIFEDNQPGMKVSTVVALVCAGLLLLAMGFAVGRMTATPDRVVESGSGGASPVVAAPTADMSVPALDMPGKDVPGLPRFPGSTRVEYRQVSSGDLLETEVEYVMTGDLEPVHDFYRDVFDNEGWVVADLGIYQGEWTFFVINGEREALVEIEARGPLVEVEIEVTEPLVVDQEEGVADSP